jgi:LysR family nitrogen assimilation transcriptional regulator
VCNPFSVPLLLAVRRELPGVELELVEEVTGNMVAQMRSGLLNLALMFDSPDLVEFQHQPLVEERLYLISKAAGGARAQAPVSLKSALALPLLLASPAQSVRQMVERAARDNGLPPPNVVAEINSLNILRLACLAGLGHAILPPAALEQELDAGLLAARPIHRPVLTRTVHVCFSRQVPMTPATRAVYRLAVSVACELCESSAWRESRAVWRADEPTAHDEPAGEP